MRIGEYLMRLLFLVSSLPIKKIGGTEIMTLRICEHLARTGNHEPFIYTIPQEDTEHQKEKVSDLFSRFDISHFKPDNIFFSKRVNDDGFLSYTRSIMSYSKGLEEALININPDIVIAMKIQPPELYCTGLSAVTKRNGIPYVIMIRGFTDLYDAPRIEGYAEKLTVLKSLFNWHYFRSSLPRYINGASGIITQTGAQQSQLKETFGMESRILNNPIDVDLIQTSVKGMSKGNTRIIRLVYVGSMIPRKNVETLLKAVRDISQRDTRNDGDPHQGNDISLHIVGGGRGEERMRQLVDTLDISTYVTFMGKLQPTELWQFLKGCDLFVFPSLSEGFPNVLLEAMACGLPIISSDFKGVRDIIQSERNGSIFPRGDHISLGNAINSMIMKNSMMEIGKYNAEFVKQFNWDNFLKQFETFIGAIGRGPAEVSHHDG